MAVNSLQPAAAELFPQPAQTPQPNPAAVPESRPDPLAYVSASRLKSFLTCRLRFYYEKVLGLRAPVTLKAHLGRSVHEALRQYHISRWSGNIVTEADLLHWFGQAFDSPEDADCLQDFGEAEKAKAIADGERLLQAYRLSGIQPVDEKPLGVEVTLREVLPEIPLPLLGVVDLVRPGPVIVDFKTTGTTPDPKRESWLHEIQLTLYSLLVESATGERIRNSELVFLVRTKTPKVIVESIPPAGQTQRRRLTSLIRIYKEGVRQRAYYPSPGQHCSWCPFRQQCSAWEGIDRLQP